MRNPYQIELPPASNVAPFPLLKDSTQAPEVPGASVIDVSDEFALRKIEVEYPGLIGRLYEDMLQTPVLRGRHLVSVEEPADEPVHPLLVALHEESERRYEELEPPKDEELKGQ